jgi:hypothetical protein
VADGTAGGRVRADPTPLDCQSREAQTFTGNQHGREVMSTELMKPVVVKPRLAKPRSEVVAGRSTYRVSKAQSLRMAAYDKKVEAAEAKKAKADKKAQTM